MADFEMGGRTCAICHQADHTEDHHRLAVMDLMVQGGSHALPKGAGGGKKASESPRGGRDDGTSRKCRFGEDYRQWITGECSYVHDMVYSEAKHGAGAVGDHRKGGGRGKGGGGASAESFARSTEISVFVAERRLSLLVSRRSRNRQRRLLRREMRKAEEAEAE